MSDQITEEALRVAAAQFKRRMRYRMVSSALLLGIGAWLLYAGFAASKPLLQTSGAVFVLYSGIIQARSFSAKRFVRDVRAELERKGER